MPPPTVRYYKECRKCDSYSGYKLRGHLETTPFDKEILKRVLEKTCEENGVLLKYHFMLVGVKVTKRSIRTYVFATTSGFYEINPSGLLIILIMQTLRI